MMEIEEFWALCAQIPMDKETGKPILPPPIHARDVSMPRDENGLCLLWCGKYGNQCPCKAIARSLNRPRFDPDEWLSVNHATSGTPEWVWCAGHFWYSEMDDGELRHTFHVWLPRIERSGQTIEAHWSIACHLESHLSDMVRQDGAYELEMPTKPLPHYLVKPSDIQAYIEESK